MPQSAQEALMVGDVTARHEIVSQDAQGYQEIVQAADLRTQMEDVEDHILPLL